MSTAAFRSIADANQTAPAGGHYTVTPGTSALSPAPRALYVNAAGNAVIEDIGGTTVTYSDLAVGAILPIKALKVTSATATLVAWY